MVENFDQKIERHGGRYKEPRVFTEQGIAILATILKSKIAIEVSIRIYDAYSKILDIMSEAKEEITIIDGYADKRVLDMIRNSKVKVNLIIKNCGNLKEQDVLKR